MDTNLIKQATDEFLKETLTLTEISKKYKLDIYTFQELFEKAALICCLKVC